MDKKNLQSVQKLTKYHAKLAMPGLSSDSKMIYNQKIKQYMSELKSGGANADAIYKSIQSGGNVFKILESQKLIVDEEIRQIKDVECDDKIVREKLALIDINVDLMRKNYFILKERFGEYVQLSLKFFFEIFEKIRKIQPKCKIDEIVRLIEATAVKIKIDEDLEHIDKDVFIEKFVFATFFVEIDEIFQMSGDKVDEKRTLKLKEVVKMFLDVCKSYGRSKEEGIKMLEDLWATKDEQYKQDRQSFFDRLLATIRSDAGEHAMGYIPASDLGKKDGTSVPFVDNSHGPVDLPLSSGLTGTKKGKSHLHPGESFADALKGTHHDDSTI